MRSSHGAHTHVASNRILREAREAFREIRGEDGYGQREAAIQALQATTFKGRDLRVLRCHGVRGKGPHDCNVPESLLWILIDLRNFCCVFHAGDQLIGSVSVSPTKHSVTSGRSAAQKKTDKTPISIKTV